MNFGKTICAAKSIKRAANECWTRLKARLQARKAFAYDRKVFSRHAGALNKRDRDAARAEIIMAYHVIEKGLTMPESRPGFGRAAVKHLANLISAFEARFGRDAQVSHAAAVLKAYRTKKGNVSIPFPELDAFLAAHPGVEPAAEPHVTKEDFFKSKNAPFPEFAASRHMVRHFAKPVPRETIMEAVKIATSAPSACNRQSVRIHIVEDRAMMNRLLEIQAGSRGFGMSADKLLVVTSSLASVRWGWERHDPYTNGGIFAMNLCNALHYLGVAHCILHWSVAPKADMAAHETVGIPPNEAIVLMIACAIPPDEFDVAASPRMSAADIAIWHGADER